MLIVVFPNFQVKLQIRQVIGLDILAAIVIFCDEYQNMGFYLNDKNIGLLTMRQQPIDDLWVATGRVTPSENGQKLNWFQSIFVAEHIFS
jgi:hypothetical protein